MVSQPAGRNDSIAPAFFHFAKSWIVCRMARSVSTFRFANCASIFLLSAVLKPPVVSVKDGDTRVLVRRETLDDLLALDEG